MVETNIRWIGKIPNNWKINKIGQIFNLRNEKVSDKEYSPLSVSKGGVVPQMESVAKSDASDDRKLVLAGDFAINSRSDRKMSCGVSLINGSVSLINIVLFPKCNDLIYNEYMNYLLKNYGFAEEFYRWGHGIVADLWTTKWQEMKNIMIPVPSFSVQKQICEFLNKKMFDIDSLIDVENKQIDILKEYKQAIITDTVTKGLDKNVKMKDSLIEWIGFVPESWKIVPLKNVCEIKTGSTPSTQIQEYFDGNINWFTPGDFKSDFIYESSRTISSFAVEDCCIRLFPENTTLLIGIGGTAGKVALIKEKGYSNQQITALISKTNFDSLYLYYLMLSGTKYLKDNALYTTLPIISNQYLSSFKVCMPSKDEQCKISNKIIEKCNDIDELIGVKKQKIETLEEYKKSLIYEYVTGKKEVIA